MCVPKVDGLRDWILEEVHGSHKFIHPDSIKKYHDLREVYWWEGLKKDITQFVAKCSNCENRISKVRWLTTRNPSSYLEVGRHQYGFCSRFALDSKAI